MLFKNPISQVFLGFNFRFMVLIIYGVEWNYFRFLMFLTLGFCFMILYHKLLKLTFTIFWNESGCSWTLMMLKVMVVSRFFRRGGGGGEQKLQKSSTAIKTMYQNQNKMQNDNGCVFFNIWTIF